MPDLHDWISEKVAAVEAGARACPSSAPLAETGAHDYAPVEVREASGQAHAAGLLVTAATVLRRCAADRRILEIHSYAGGTFEPYACLGCGSDGEWGPIVEHTNDCETLLALAAGYGITDDELARLDRPQPPERQPSTAPTKPLSELLADLCDQYVNRETNGEALGDLTGHRFTGLDIHKINMLMPIATDQLPPTPLERAMDILSPHLRDQPLYRPTA
ncbi:hypothetical protein [Streptomyces sp. NPDC127040]|uniref:hypothetical protein n=1 Tax=Streptomyces sp. NPDC127040 TaxID=3347116 RepID=UPI0036649DE0